MSKIVERTLDVFELFAEQRRPLSLTDMASLLKIPISSCHDMMRALEGRGYVYETAPRSGYYPTGRLHAVCETIRANESLVRRAAPLLEQIRESLDETVTLAKATGARAVYLLVFEPETAIRYSVKVGAEIRSLYATSAGKALLGTMPELELKHLLKSAVLKRFTGKTITSKSKLMNDINASRAKGWFLNREETVPGVVTVSSTFSWNNATYIITAAGPANRMEPKLERTAQLVMRKCKELAE